MKACTKCGVEKPLTEFYIDYGRPTPRPHSQCKACMLAQQKERYRTDPDYRARKLAYFRQWRDAHREESNAYQRAYQKRQRLAFQRVMEAHGILHSKGEPLDV